MDSQLTTSNTLIQNRPAYVHALYNQYGAMLLGYIYEVVNNMAVAEQYLIAVFKDLPHEVEEIAKADINSFCKLQKLARKKLSDFFDSVQDCAVEEKPSLAVADNNNKYITLMTNEQRAVFCGVYWHGKTIAKLAAELEKTEEAVRKLLKECFITIRSNSR